VKNLREYALSPQLMMPWHPGKTVSCARAAELLGCAESTVRRMIQDGTLEGFKRRRNRPQSHYLVIYESICRVGEDWKDQAGISTASEAPPAATEAQRSKARR
jgi:excisionase family DNA binding protein